MRSHVSALAIFLVAFCAPAFSDDETKKVSKVESVSPSTLAKELRRDRGQTRFITGQRGYGNVRALGLEVAFAAAAPEAAGGGTEKREVQESDVWAVHPTTKTLYLLNSNRGLQAISAENKLLGHAAATGNSPEDMFIDVKGNRLIVIEHDYQKRFESEEGDPRSRVKTQVVIYDISDPVQPTFSHSVAVEGYKADCRIVGEILYIASSKWEDRYRFYGASDSTAKPKGKVTSLSLAGEKVTIAKTLDIDLPQLAPEMMRIVETSVGGNKYTYHLLALVPGEERTSISSWWDRTSSIEVIDITDPHGEIKAVMKVQAKGHIEKASQMTLRDNNLIVISNYVSTPGNWERIRRRIAGEVFSLPKGDGTDRVLSPQEAEWRALNLEHEVGIFQHSQPESSSDDLDAMRAKIAAGDQGLKGRFVRVESSTILEKRLPDSYVSTGDTQGQSASLRSVVFDGEEILAYWVPGNMVDPLDLFHVEGDQISFVRRLEFDGWVERGIPFRYEGRFFVLGLGFTMPITDESGRRFPQAKLFEITGVGEATHTEVVGSLVLKDANLWPALQGKDKYIDARVDAKGQGSAMFSVYAWGSAGFRQGGKLIGFDLKAAVEGRKDAIFTDGALLPGDSHFLRRVFVDPTSNSRKVFSDSQLADYGSVDAGVGQASDVREAVARIELARNIKAYLPIGEKLSRGIQFISDDHYYGYGDTGAQQTVLRLVPDKKADAEIRDMLAELKLPGNYKGHTVVDGGKAILVLTEWQQEIGGAVAENQEVDPWAPKYDKKFETRYAVTRVTFDDESLESFDSVQWADAQTENHYRWNPYWGSNPSMAPFTLLDDAHAVVSTGGELKEAFIEGDTLALREFVIAKVPGEVTVSQAFRTFGGAHWLIFDRPVQVTGKEKDEDHSSYKRTFLAPLKQRASGGWKMGKAINIAGDALGLVDTSKGRANLVTADSVYQDEQVARYPGHNGGEDYVQRSPIYSDTLLSLALGDEEATLVDLTSAEGRSRSDLTQAGETGPFLVLKAAEEFGGYGFMPFGGVAPWHRRAATGAHLEVVGLDGKGFFQLATRAIDGAALSGYASLVRLFPDPDQKGVFLAVVMASNRLQVLQINSSDWKAKALRITPVNERFERTSAVDSMIVPNTYAWGWSNRTDGISFNPKKRSIVVSAGLPGNCQFWLGEMGKKDKKGKKKSE